MKIVPTHLLRSPVFFVCVLTVQIGVIWYLIDTIQTKRDQLGANVRDAKLTETPHTFTPPEGFKNTSPYELKNIEENEPEQWHFTEGYDHQPEWLPEQPVITLNDDQLNDRFNYQIPKPERTYRIVALGDSFTFGQFVDTKDSYPEQLEELLNESCSQERNYEVINLGVNGYDLEHSAHRFIKRGKKYEPDLILWLVLHNDLREIDEIIEQKMYENLRPHADQSESGSYVYHTISIEKREEAYREAVAYFVAEYDQDALVQYQRIVLEKLNEHFDRDILFYTIPAGGPYLDELLAPVNGFRNTREHTHLYQSDLSLEKGVELFRDGHPNPRGYQRIADDLYTYMRDQELIPCATRDD